MARRYPPSGYAPDPAATEYDAYLPPPAKRQFFKDTYSSGSRGAEYYDSPAPAPPRRAPVPVHYLDESYGRDYHDFEAHNRDPALYDPYQSQHDPYADYGYETEEIDPHLRGPSYPPVARRPRPPQEMEFSGHEAWGDPYYQNETPRQMGSYMGGEVVKRKRMAPYVDQKHQPTARIPRPNVGIASTDYSTTISRLKQVLKLHMDKRELWIGAMNSKKKIFYYNAITLAVRFERPPTDKAIVFPQATLMKELDEYQPATLVIKNISPKLTEEALIEYFGAFGKVHFAKIRLTHPAYAFIRMERVVGQNKVLTSRQPHKIKGEEFFVEAPFHRLFVSRIPEGIKSSELLHFFSDKAKQIYHDAFVIDAYRPIPFQQFAFIVFAEEGNMAEHFGKVSDMIINNAPISCDHFPLIVNDNEGKSAVKTEDVKVAVVKEQTPKLLRSYGEGDIALLFAQKLAELAPQKSMASKLRSLESIADEVQFLMRLWIQEQGTEKSPNDFMIEMNAELLKCSEDKVRSYLSVQEHIYDLCREVLEGSIAVEKSKSNESTNAPKNGTAPNAKESTEEQGNGAEALDSVE